MAEIGQTIGHCCHMKRVFLESRNCDRKPPRFTMLTMSEDPKPEPPKPPLPTRPPIKVRRPTRGIAAACNPDPIEKSAYYQKLTDIFHELPNRDRPRFVSIVIRCFDLKNGRPEAAAEIAFPEYAPSRLQSYGLVLTKKEASAFVRLLGAHPNKVHAITPMDYATKFGRIATGERDAYTLAEWIVLLHLRWQPSLPKAFEKVGKS